MADAKLKQKDMELIERSGLFAGNWYHKVYALPFHRDAIKHYHNEGWKLGYNPSPQFITVEYLKQNAKIMGKKSDPLLHYLKKGKNQNLELVTEAYKVLENSELFDKEWYIRKYQIPEGEDALAHYINKGWKLRYNPSNQFCTEEYFEENPDIRNRRINPLVHYLMEGKEEGRKMETNSRLLLEESEYFDEEWYRRVYHIDEDIDAKFHYMVEGWRLDYNPSPKFITGEYMRQNKDVAGVGKNPLVHYLKYGKNEGRDIETKQRSLLNDCEYFDEEWYRKKYKITEQIDAKYHYLTEGWKLGYDPSLNFSTKSYLQFHGDVNAAGINPLLHYLNSGKKENREIAKVQYVDAKPTIGFGQVFTEKKKEDVLPTIMISFVGFSDGEAELTAIHLVNELYELGYPVILHSLGYKEVLEEVRELLNKNIYVLETDDKSIIARYMEDYQVKVVNTHHLECEKIFAQISMDSLTCGTGFRHVASIHKMYEVMEKTRFNTAINMIWQCVDDWTYWEEKDCYYFKEMGIFEKKEFYKIDSLAETESKEKRFFIVEDYLNIFFPKEEEGVFWHPKISVYLNGDTTKPMFGKCIQSIYHQNYKNMEICIGSKENGEESKSTIEFYQKYYNQNSKCIFSSIEKEYQEGLKSAFDMEGEIIWIVDGNTMFPLDYLSKMVAIFEDKRIGIAYSQTVSLDKKENMQENKAESYPYKGTYEINHNMCKGNSFSNYSAVFLRKNMMESIENIEEIYKYPENLQWYIYITMLRWNYISYVADTCCYIEKEEKKQQKEWEYYQEKADIIKKMVKLYDLSHESIKKAYDALVQEYAANQEISYINAKRKINKLMTYSKLLRVKYGLSKNK